MKPQKQYILEAWNNFMSKVITGKVSDLQRWEMKRCFYAGFVALYALEAELTLLSDTEGMEALQSIQTELENFSKDISMGVN